MTIPVTRHAIKRYQKRVENVSKEIVIERLTTPAIEAAANLPCQSRIVLSNGCRAVINYGKVITVIPPAGTRPSKAKMKRMARNTKKARG